MRKLLLLTGCLLAAALFVSACGDSESDEDQIANAIETSATSTDPADCEAVNTIAFLEQIEFTEGQEAVESCEEDAEDATGDSEEVNVSEVKIDGTSATAEAELVGGALDGQTIEIGLVQEDGDWKVNQFESFTVFNRGQLLAAFAKAQEEEAENGEEDEAASCIIEEFEAAPNSEIEEALLTPDVFIELVEDCIEA